MMEASGLPSDSASVYAGTLFHDFDHNAIVGSPFPIMKPRNSSPCSAPGFPAPGDDYPGYGIRRRPTSPKGKAGFIDFTGMHGTIS
jgi:hypothetical protein